MIFCAVTGPTPGERIELRGCCGVEVDGPVSGLAPPPSRPCPCPHRRGGAGSSRDGTTIRSPSGAPREVQLATGPLSVDARAIAAGSSDRVRRRASPTQAGCTPGRTTAPWTSTTSAPSRRSRSDPRAPRRSRCRPRGAALDDDLSAGPRRGERRTPRPPGRREPRKPADGRPRKPRRAAIDRVPQRFRGLTGRRRTRHGVADLSIHPPRREGEAGEGGDADIKDFRGHDDAPRRRGHFLRRRGVCVER